MTEDLIHKGALIEKCAKIMGWKKRTEFNGELYYWTDPEIGDLWIKADEWRPDTDWNHTMQFVDKLREKGYTFNMHIDEEGIGFVVFANADEGIEVVFSPETEIKDVREAILTAATKI